MLTLLVALSTALAAPAERVFVVVLDGVEAEESVGLGAAAVPFLWGTYLPQGVYLEGLTNRDATTTEPAHRTILTGRRQPLSNFPWYEGRNRQRALTPTVFEAYGRSRGETGTGLVTGNTVFMDSQGAGLYPGFDGYGAFEPVDTAIARQVDTVLVDGVLDDLAANDRRLILINLHEADKDAHAARETRYVNGITREDRLVHALQTELGRPGDAWLVLADHGRHVGDDWRGHGDACSGCRSSWLIAWGAGIRSDGARIQLQADLTDIAPTVAVLLDFDLPHARGRVLDEILATPVASVEPDAALVDPDLTADSSGRLHLVAQRLPVPGATPALIYRRSDDGGLTWTRDEVFGTGEVRRPEVPQIVARGSTVVRAWRAWLPSRLTWGIAMQRSLDGGESWSEISILDSDVMHAALPGVALDADGEVWTLQSEQFTAMTDDPAVFSLSGTSALEEGIRAEPEVHMPTHNRLLATDNGLVAAWAAVPADLYFEANENREIVVARPGADGLLTVRVTDAEHVDLAPTLIAHGDALVMAWASLRGPAGTRGTWSIQMSRSLDGGTTWQAPEDVDTGSAEAIAPSLASIDGTLLLAFTEVDGARHTARVIALREDGTLGWRRTLSESSEGVIEGVRLAGSASAWSAVWHEATDGHRLAHAEGPARPGPARRSWQLQLGDEPGEILLSNPSRAEVRVVSVTAPDSADYSVDALPEWLPPQTTLRLEVRRTAELPPDAVWVAELGTGARLEVTLSARSPEEPPEDDGCGCAGAPGLAGLSLAPLLWLRRRRQQL